MTSAQPSRLTGLDGLRGLAAFAVVLYHGSKIAFPALDGTGSGVFRALSESPVKLAFAGTEAVLVFFALSGLVVALPALRPGFSWPAYFGSRLLRLYLPVWAALLFATVLILLVPRGADGVTAGSWLQTANAATVTPGTLAGEASLMQRSYDIDNVLWSLRWEVIFSVCLPLFVLVAGALRRAGMLVVPLCVGLSLAGRLLGIEALVYLPVFLAGTVLATRIGDLQAWGARRSRWFWIAAAGASATLLICGWLARPLAPAGTEAGLTLWGLAAAGAVGLVATAVGSAGAARMLSRRVPRWLGRVSFSLYLVHVPVLATLAFAWGESAWPWVVLAGIPLSLVTAELFTRLVERPSHRLAHAVRQRLSAGAAQRYAVREPTLQ